MRNNAERYLTATPSFTLAPGDLSSRWLDMEAICVGTRYVLYIRVLHCPQRTSCCERCLRLHQTLLLLMHHCRDVTVQAGALQLLLHFPASALHEGLHVEEWRDVLDTVLDPGDHVLLEAEAASELPSE